MNPFELALPERLDDASGLGGPEVAFKAAGIDLLDRLKERIESPERLVDLLRLKKELGGIRPQGDGILLGPLVTLQQLADAPDLAAAGYTALRESAAHTATPQVRNRATLGGNLLQKTRCWYLRSAGFGCLHGDDGPMCMARDGENRYHAVLESFDCVRVHPSNTAPALTVLGAVVEARKGEATRRLPIAELWPRRPVAEAPEHTLAPDEILTAVFVPAGAAKGRSAYRESREKQSHDWATTAAAVHLHMDGQKIAMARVCLGAVAPNPYVAEAAEAVLRGQAPSPELFREAARAAYADALPLSQNAYKVEVGQAVLVDALTAAAGGK